MLLRVTRVGESREEHRRTERDERAGGNPDLDARRAQPCNLGAPPGARTSLDHGPSVETMPKKPMKTVALAKSRNRMV